MDKFTKKSKQPLGPETIRAFARKLRKYADRLDACADPQTAQEKRALTRLIHSLVHHMRWFSDKYHGRTIRD